MTLSHGIEDRYIGYIDRAISEGVWYFEVTNKGSSEEHWKLNTRSHVQSDNVIRLHSDY